MGRGIGSPTSGPARRLPSRVEASEGDTSERALMRIEEPDPETGIKMEGEELAGVALSGAELPRPPLSQATAGVASFGVQLWIGEDLDAVADLGFFDELKGDVFDEPTLSPSDSSSKA